ncbi:MAG: peptidase [Draconibacterium sp.]|nr:MAG: peptidase [Draconibacterium sp.]
MKTRIFLLFILLPSIALSQIRFDDFFFNKSLRFDYLLGGNKTDVQVYPVQMKKEPFWAGPQNNLFDLFNYGTYRFRVIDQASDNLIFSKGFCTLFQEWQTTAEAKTKNKTFYHSAVFPFPKQKVQLVIEARQWSGDFKEIFSTIIDPDDYFILDEQPVLYDTVQLVSNGMPKDMVDIVVLAEGYSQQEKQKFYDDVRRVSDYLFKEEPFQSEKDKFNVTAVFTPSKDSGTDIPGEGIYRNTIFNSSFYTFDISRYLTTSDIKGIYDAAAGVPYDFIYILVNSERYGGGGFYNLVTVCTADNKLTKEVFVHEFGHGFGGLSDEYYSSTVAYEDYYNLDIEPWEPNITTLKNFEKKWESMVADSVPTPTPAIPKYNKCVGVFEGGGYVSKGIYRPYIDCRMKSNEAHSFCPVCQEALKKVIYFYADLQ